MGRDSGIAWSAMAGLYFVSDVVLAICFEPVLRLLVAVGRKIPPLARASEAVRLAMLRTAAQYGSAGRHTTMTLRRIPKEGARGGGKRSAAATVP